MIWIFGIFGGLIFLFACCIAFKAYRNTYDIAFNHIELPLKNTSTAWSDLRILHLSDFHMENISITPELLYEKLKDKPIDLIALTGDYLDRKKSIPKFKKYLEKLNELNVRYGIYAVYGNHDYCLTKENYNKLDRLMKDMGVHVLRNENRTIKLQSDLLTIIGTDDPSTHREQLEKSFANVPDKSIRLVLSHDPNIVLKMKEYTFDYLLSGHFHGGQIHWPQPYHLVKMGKLARMKMIRGLHLYENKPFYISEGLGQTGVNFRVRSRPEITLHNLFLEQAG